jgi:hypothetical protein
MSNLKNYNDDDLEGVSFVILEKLGENYMRLMNNDFSEVTEATNKLLFKNNITFASDSTSFKKLWRE